LIGLSEFTGPVTNKSTFGIIHEMGQALTQRWLEGFALPSRACGGVSDACHWMCGLCPQLIGLL